MTEFSVMTTGLRFPEGPVAMKDGSVFEQLREGQPVTFDAGKGEKGLRAENVRLAD